MPSVYIETSIFSYLVADPSNDLIVAAHQNITREWWKDERERFDLYTSELVYAEITRGDPEMIEKRKEKAEGIAMLYNNNQVKELFQVYLKRLGLSEKSSADLFHIAYTVANELDYLLTWNCSHIANAEVIQRLHKVNHEISAFTPLILTPEVLTKCTEE